MSTTGHGLRRELRSSLAVVAVSLGVSAGFTAVLSLLFGGLGG
jgi:hypothetical protein